MMKDSEDIPTANKFNAISSCMAIRREVFSDYRYNEELFMDQVDYNFCIDQRKRGKKFYILNVDITQNFYQFQDHLSVEQGWKRTSIRIQDIVRHGKILEKNRYDFLAIVKSLSVALSISIRCRSALIFFRSIPLIIRVKRECNL